MDRPVAFRTLAQSQRNMNSPLFSSLEELHDKLTELLGKSFNRRERNGALKDSHTRRNDDVSRRNATTWNFLLENSSDDLSPWNNIY